MRGKVSSQDDIWMEELPFWEKISSVTSHTLLSYMLFMVVLSQTESDLHPFSPTKWLFALTFIVTLA